MGKVAKHTADQLFDQHPQFGSFTYGAGSSIAFVQFLEGFRRRLDVSLHSIDEKVDGAILYSAGLGFSMYGLYCMGKDLGLSPLQTVAGICLTNLVTAGLYKLERRREVTTRE